MLFLEISQNSQDNTCDRISYLIKLQALTLAQVFSCEKFLVASEKLNWQIKDFLTFLKIFILKFRINVREIGTKKFWELLKLMNW